MIADRRIASFVAALCLAMFAALAPSVAASAQDRVITAVEPKLDNGGLAIRFTLTAKAPVHSFSLRNPDRIAIDFDDTLPAVHLGELPENPLVQSIRHGMVSADRYRVIFRLKERAIGRVVESTADDQAIVDLMIAPAKDKAGERQKRATSRLDAAVDQAGAGASAAKPKGPRPLLIVLDPGHGGIDEGAVSPSGTKEKDINLENARMLATKLERYPNVEVKLTHDTDVFVPLEARAAMARKLNADLFLSIHADSIHYTSLRGATVYTLSEKASDALSSQIAATENASDRFAPDGFQASTPEIFDILLDLTRRETVSFSEHFAASLVADLKKNDIDLINRPKRAAGFRVLKSPDVPSVLLEMGFLSNAKDETLLKDDDWRNKITSAIAESIIRFFRGGKADALRKAEAK
ncbi:N-acetylmuramoyl-L-alanine amidase [Jiella sp. MQZ9-1]|uniref:N-acetylmuramoyl-L-alanine amidase n=1 Tax=Jiella flava TaxID=2816857 RepID=A0A939FWK9_9HYPH|nr:N-acetylmuramoyl-L-alanine amidase [Jiella flava]MBO0662847.1 N-acetylmuramoyl-L-alanine amidase [Jiella flava]MCD2471392.1 N-acetylmuramoyl-L-alanine amidase [Jiella flava]